MEDFLFSRPIGAAKTLNIATLSDETIKEAEAEHLGFGGYFIFTSDDVPRGGIEILGKAPSFDAAMELMTVFDSL